MGSINYMIKESSCYNILAKVHDSALDENSSCFSCQMGTYFKFAFIDDFNYHLIGKRYETIDFVHEKVYGYENFDELRLLKHLHDFAADKSFDYFIEDELNLSKCESKTSLIEVLLSKAKALNDATLCAEIQRLSFVINDDRVFSRLLGFAMTNLQMTISEAE